MTISNFERLLQEAAQQPDPQHLLFVFTEKGVPERPTSAQEKSSMIDSGGTLTPVVCVDKTLNALTSFSDLVKESEATGKHWDIVLVGCLAGRNGAAPSASEIDQNLEMMVNAVKTGTRLSRFLAFDRAGDPLQFV
ncbi:MAG: ribonucleotide reductase subunit alpha [Herbaspirillum sp.]